ncbi:Di-sulfide bridge nucleocytoplasmic transport domain-containing protein [Gigaspora rosea]|uniref:Di-sulfide bridge nucleocytoplasmic transport domain-containing protein n=1 Tax=Gigaspora rosea TaxID=44941 RepID=A0A397V8F2_9GLOM|nr:Di-sulfide bridge nucleocytoplasmic transport domain-containing protein [Gigaspora rosea]
MTCVQERIGSEMLDEEEQAILKEAIALSLSGNNERTKQQIYIRRRYTYSLNDLLEDICSYLYFLIKATCLSIVLVILSLIAIMAVQFAMAFLSAVNTELESMATEVTRQAHKCTQNYLINQCDPVSRVPFLEENCTFWEKCIGQDPYNVVTRAEVISGLIARLISAFISNLTHESMIFILLLNIIIFGTVLHRFT